MSLASGALLMLARRLLGTSGFVSLTDRAVVGEGAGLTLTTLAAGGSDSRLDGELAITGEAAFVEAGGALLARERQRHDANLVVRHDAVGGMSRQLWRSVADDRATCSVAARVEVARDAQNTDGEQSLKGLLLPRPRLAAGGRYGPLAGVLALPGEAAFVEAGGAWLAPGRQRHAANLVVRHDAVGGMSRQLWRSVADDRATCSVAARVEVARDAQKTDGEQSLKGLLLARTATVNAKPELEIFADDVKCAHAATVGELDKAALFYLARRGVPPEEAIALFTRAFLAEPIDRTGGEAVREA